MLAIFVGVRAEHAAVDKQIEVLERRELPDYYIVSRGAFGDAPVLVCRTGMGEERVRGIVERVLSEYPVSGMVSAGVASGAPGNLPVGDLAIATRSFLRQAGLGVFRARGDADYRLLQLAGRAANRAWLRHVAGDCLTMSPLPAAPVKRATVGELGGFAVLDTDGYWLAESAYEHGMPFLSVRASLGNVFERVPQTINFLGKRSYVSGWAVLRQTVTHPAQLPGFIRLADAVLVASRSLGRFFGAFLPEWEANPAPNRLTGVR